MGAREAQVFPWSEAMAFGFGVLRLSPLQFWSMTPRELAAAHRGVGGLSAVAPVERAMLDRLILDHPD